MRRQVKVLTQPKWLEVEMKKLDKKKYKKLKIVYVVPLI